MHNNLLMRLSIALDNLTKTIHPIDEDQKLLFSMRPPSTTLFRGELAKLQKGNIEHASALTVSPTPAVPSISYAQRFYVGRGRRSNFHSSRRGGYSEKRGGQGRGQGRSA